MLQRTGRMRRLVLQIEIDVRSSGQRELHEVGVSRPIGVSLDPAHGFVDPVACRARTAVDVICAHGAILPSIEQLAILDHPCGHADGDAERGQILRHDRVRADDRALADHDTATDGDLGADPDVAFDPYA